MNKIFLLECPQCKNQMKYSAQNGYTNDKKKKCVYCGKNFDVAANLIRLNP